MNFIQYIKQAWKAGTSGGTPLSPDRLNHMEDGIKNNNDMISELNNNTTTTYENAIITYAPALALVNIMPAKLTNTVAIRSWTTVAILETIINEQPTAFSMGAKPIDNFINPFEVKAGGNS